jgi:hypothetical protein
MTVAETKIAGKKTVADWQKLKATLVVGGDAGPWKVAFEDFFHERLRTRYFAPIDVLKTMSSKNGEGFSIVAIQCSLIEFLGATLQGKSYRHGSELDGGEPGEYEYCDSKDMFVSFLASAVPFKSTFSKGLARKFYTGVRCGLLHEARTKNGWTITAKRGLTWIVDTSNPANKIVHRDNLQRAFHDFVTWYGEALPADKKLQEAFIRKFDSLCED